MSELLILLVGDADRPEFRDCRSTLGRWGRLVCHAEVSSAVAALARGELAADVICLAQAYPGQFSHQAIDGLRSAAPLARLLGLLGSWCEGEMRSGDPWPGVVRVYWHQAAAWLDEHFDRLCRGKPSAWGLPLTATEEEHWLVETDGHPPDGQGLIAIHTRAAAMQQWLCEAFRRCGWSTVWLRPQPQHTWSAACLSGVTAAIFDGSDLRGEGRAQLAYLARQIHPAPTFALLGFPRIEDRRRALAAGAAAVLSKPLGLAELYRQLHSSWTNR